MIIGTSHFKSIRAAEDYFHPYGYVNLVEVVRDKITNGEIHIGEPDHFDGDRVYLNTAEGRYFIETKEA